MSKLDDLTGKRINNLVVLRKDDNYHGNVTKWIVQCDCGNIVSMFRQNLASGRTMSCGCKAKENMSKRQTIHGKSHDRIYRCWLHMAYKHYGGRGIKVCDEWLVSDNFFKWAYANGYADNLSIDRIDVNGDYEPSNCRWATSKEQGRNKRNNIRITFDGITLTESEWCERMGYNRGLIGRRIKRGWSIEKAITKPSQRSKR